MMLSTWIIDILRANKLVERIHFGFAQYQDEPTGVMAFLGLGLFRTSYFRALRSKEPF